MGFTFLSGHELDGKLITLRYWCDTPDAAVKTRKVIAMFMREAKKAGSIQSKAWASSVRSKEWAELPLRKLLFKVVFDDVAKADAFRKYLLVAYDYLVLVDFEV